MKRDVLIILILLIIAAYFIRLFWVDLTQTINANDQTPVGEVIFKRNTVQRRYQNSNLWDRLQIKSSVYAGNLIRVPQASSAILYIEDNAVALDENSLIRITLSDDGEVQIDLSSGSLSVISDESSGSISLNINNEIIRTTPATVISASINEDESLSVQYLESADEVLSNELFAITETTVQLVNPAEESVFRYDETLPVINLNWTPIEYAVSYITEISDSPDFTNIVERRESSAAAVSANLEEGQWYWRVTPVFPSFFNETENISAVSSFKVERSQITASELERLDFSEWLEIEIPQEFLPVYETAPLHTLANIDPADNTRFGIQELMEKREIDFSWTPVDADSYVFSLYLQTSSGRRRIIRTPPGSSTNYTLNDFRGLENGTYIWQVEAVNNRDGRERPVITGEQTFVLDVPIARSVQAEGAGVNFEN